MKRNVLFKAGILLLSSLLLPGLSGCGAISSLMATPTPTATSTPTMTPIPTSTPSPATPTPAPSVVGHVRVASEVELERTLIILCQEVSRNVCIIKQEFSTTTDNRQMFDFYNLPSGRYYVLYNPFPVASTAGYWRYWENRKLDFTSGRTLGDSLGDVMVSAAIDGPTGDFIVQVTDYPMVIELLAAQQGRPLGIQVVAGQTTEVSINVRAFNP